MQNFPVHPTPTAEQWNTIEQLNDLLASTSDLQLALETGLQMLLRMFGQDGAVLYLPYCCDPVRLDWTLVQAPAPWQTAIHDPGSPLRTAIERVLTSGLPEGPNAQTGAAAILPLSLAERSLGVLALAGSAVPEEAYPTWQMFLRPIARLAHLRSSASLDRMPGYLDLLKSRNTLRAMFDNLPISIYIIDQTYRLVAVNNSRAARVSELPRKLVGGRCFEQFYQRSDPCPGCRVRETFRSAQSTTRLFRESNALDNFIEFEISTFPILDEEDNAIQTILVETDVTEKRNLEANLVQAEKLAAVGQLAAGVAHEINNPLTAIIANAQLLLREIPAEEEDILDSIKLIETAGTRASQVVRNLLNIARKEQYDLAPVDLNDTLNHALSLVQHELVGRPIQVYLSLDDQIPPVYASQDQLQGVWINLILNAIDALNKEPGEIMIDSRFTGSEFQVTIQDNGKGIEKEHLSRVFEPFFTTKSPGRGTGLGLSVCLRVIRYHGGRILVDSEPGQWTRFTVTLPGNRDSEL